MKAEGGGLSQPCPHQSNHLPCISFHFVHSLSHPPSPSSFLTSDLSVKLSHHCSLIDPRLYQRLNNLVPLTLANYEHLITPVTMAVAQRFVSCDQLPSLHDDDSFGTARRFRPRNETATSLSRASLPNKYSRVSKQQSSQLLGRWRSPG